MISAVAAAGVPRPYVLVGHSMGGRIATRAAADDAEAVRGGAAATLAAVVIEDMCVSTRDGAAPLADDAARAAVDNFSKPGGRRFASWEAARAAILPFYGDEPRVDSWKGKRVRAAPGGGSWWSDINPAAQRLARDTVLASSDGDEAWTTLADGKVPFEVHCWYADEPARSAGTPAPAGSTICDGGCPPRNSSCSRARRTRFTIRRAPHSSTRSAQWSTTRRSSG